MKVTLLAVLGFIERQEVFETMNLLNAFGYTYCGARTRLRRLEKQNSWISWGICSGAYHFTRINQEAKAIGVIA